MCGIAGIYQQNEEPVALDLLKRMTDSIAHRGPDGEGHSIQGPVGLGHRRLAIIDLSPAGRQPMADKTGHRVVTYNGEIYNFQELRKELEALGHTFRSRTDTEVLLYAYQQWGDSCVDHFNGMFAFAVLDQTQKKLFLARDRYGVKPLYWYFKEGLFLFASEIKAILQHPAVRRAVHLPALNEYFTFQNIFSDLTLFEGIHLLPPASTLTLPLRKNSAPEVKRYWDYQFQPASWSEKECEDRLYELFVNAVKRQLVSDVPIGSYLSGGMDSGSIVAVARQHLGRLTTFAGGFDLSSASGMELAFDERANSEFLSNLLKTEHYEMVMHAGDMEHIMPELVWHLEDLRVGQCYPNYYVARLAGKFVKVVLSGAGGDELFGGYPWRYFTGLNAQGAEDYHKNYYAFWQRLVADENKPKLYTSGVAAQLRNHSTFDVFRGVFAAQPSLKTKEDVLSASLYFELKTFLHGLLVVEDKVSMAHSLETRVPFLDNDLVDFALKVPGSLKLKNLDKILKIDENVPAKKFVYEQKTSEGKMILRKAMARLIPPEVTQRTKQGFSGPDASWFRGESIDYVRRLLCNPKAALFDYLNPAYVTQIVNEHCSGKINHRLFIWSLLSFELWCQKFLKGSWQSNEPKTLLSSHW
ncbi:MAG: asparagine synthase (glutamine-hydrolyzing) [Elusimicrobia bacterium RIFCSPLOWO2_01_FULL_59_12]|nr:MAG: asparagine synthase (glutamine-hydrolyzing) [Elusimicrobia bacterium RIFCSPLOWO2_01_FULL_59_12]